MNCSNIKLLDCTLRDGGQGLESSLCNSNYSCCFTDEIICNSIKHLVNSDIDIIELGYIEKNCENGHFFSNYASIEKISKFIPKQRNPKQMYVALFTGPDIEEKLIPNYNPNFVDGTRVILRYSELCKSLDYCEMLSNKGYKVFVQPMLTMRYTDEELKMIINRVNQMNAFALYFVDSFGYMESDDVERFFYLYNELLDPNIYIGFHAHNNLNLAFSNAKHLLKISNNRKIILDSTVSGMGQGAGNLQTELILPYLNCRFGKKYNLNDVLDVCDEIESLTVLGNWGYSVELALPAIHKTAYKYASVMRKKYGFSYKKINYILENMPTEYRNRYTDSNLKYVLSSITY